MNFDISWQIAGIAVLNAVALVLLLAVEIKLRRRKSPDRPTEQQPAASPSIGLDRWIDEVEAIEQLEQRQGFAARGDFLPRGRRAVNG